MYHKVDTQECTSCINLTGYYRYNNKCSKTCPQNYTKFNNINGYNQCVYSYSNENSC